MGLRRVVATPNLRWLLIYITITPCHQNDRVGRTHRAMEPEWSDSRPIYRQLRDRMVALILEGSLPEGDPLPSVRAVAADYRLNPLTVLKAYQTLADEGLVEKRRGRGMYVGGGARAALLAGERERFLRDQWPPIAATIQRLGFSLEDLLAAPAR